MATHARWWRSAGRRRPARPARLDCRSRCPVDRQRRPGCGCSTPASASWAARCWRASRWGSPPRWQGSSTVGGPVQAVASRPPGTWSRRSSGSGAGSSVPRSWRAGSRGPSTCAADLGVRFRWIDLLGIPIGVAGQFLVALMYVPSPPTSTTSISGSPPPPNASPVAPTAPGYAVIAVATVVGAPFFEELFFRGVILRALARLFGNWGGWVGPALAIVVSGVLFGLAHAESLQLLGSGRVRGDPRVVSYRTGRLGMNMVAHAVVQRHRPDRRGVPRGARAPGPGLTWRSGRPGIVRRPDMTAPCVDVACRRAAGRGLPGPGEQVPPGRVCRYGARAVRRGGTD